MDVKDLIHELLECEKDSTVEVIIESNGYDNEFSDVEFSAKRIFNSEYAQLFVDIGSMILVEKSEYDELKERVEDLEAELEDIKK